MDNTNALYHENTDFSAEQLFTISVFTENKIGLLNRVTIVFTRREVNIESITASESEVKGIYRYTIVARTTLEMVEKVVRQLEKIVDVVKAIYHEEHEIIHQEIALYKIPINAFSNGRKINIEKVVRDNHARILTIDPEYVVIEKTGHPQETQLLFDLLEPYGILEFARSGRVAVAKPMKNLDAYLKELESFTTNDKLH